MLENADDSQIREFQSRGLREKKKCLSAGSFVAAPMKESFEVRMKGKLANGEGGPHCL